MILKYKLIIELLQCRNTVVFNVEKNVIFT